MSKASKKKSSSFTRFNRINPNEIDKGQILSNSFIDKQGAKGSWGERAFKDLCKTQGKGFRNEKNKKKRGSYKGGRIDISVNSVKFD